MTSPFEHAAALKAALAVSAPLAPLLPALNKLSVSDTSEVRTNLFLSPLRRSSHAARLLRVARCCRPSTRQS